jgi:hypothetical protein
MTKKPRRWPWGWIVEYITDKIDNRLFKQEIDEKAARDLKARLNEIRRDTPSPPSEEEE